VHVGGRALAENASLFVCARRTSVVTLTSYELELTASLAIRLTCIFVRACLQDLGSHPDKLFKRFEASPIASASLAQVGVASLSPCSAPDPYAVPLTHAVQGWPGALGAIHFGFALPAAKPDPIQLAASTTFNLMPCGTVRLPLGIDLGWMVG